MENKNLERLENLNPEEITKINGGGEGYARAFGVIVRRTVVNMIFPAHGGIINTILDF